MAERKTARCFPLRLEQEGGRRLCRYQSRIIGYGVTKGDTLEEALHQAKDLLGEAILGMMANDEDVPSPSPARGRRAAGADRGKTRILSRNAGGGARQGRICGASEVDPVADNPPV